MKDTDEIYADYIAGNLLTEEETIILERWKQQSETNRQIDNDICRLKREGTALRNRTDKGRIFTQIKSGVQKALCRQRFIRISSVATGAVLLSAVMVAIIIQNQTSNTEIASSSDQIELTLDNGQKIILCPGKELELNDEIRAIVENEGMLVYNGRTKTENNACHIINIPRGSEYVIQFADKTKVHLNSGSSLRYPVTSVGNRHEVYLSGEAYFEVVPDTSRKFIIHAGSVSVEVMGTSFNVNAYPEENKIVTTLTEGIVQVSSDDKCHKITPGMQVICYKDGRASECLNVDTELYTSWKDGYYYFRQKPLGEIMNILARWYDIEVRFDDFQAQNIEFSGRLKRRENISYLFEKMAETRDVGFVVDGKIVTVTTK